jgi:hypothetical protein
MEPGLQRDAGLVIFILIYFRGYIDNTHDFLVRATV